MKLYGLGRRGVAVLPPDTDPDVNPFDTPIPLFTERDIVEAIIKESGTGAWHVIEYEVVES